MSLSISFVQIQWQQMYLYIQIFFVHCEKTNIRNPDNTPVPKKKFQFFTRSISAHGNDCIDCLTAQRQNNHVFSLLILYLDRMCYIWKIHMLHACRGGVCLLGPLCLHLLHIHQKLGLFWAQRLEPRVRQFNVACAM